MRIVRAEEEKDAKGRVERPARMRCDPACETTKKIRKWTEEGGYVPEQFADRLPLQSGIKRSKSTMRIVRAEEEKDAKGRVEKEVSRASTGRVAGMDEVA
jgi:hypothetical protein